MKKLLGVTFLFLILCFSSNAKILNVGFHNLEVPKNFYLKKIDNINFLEDMCQEFSTCYGIMSKKMKEIIDELESGESLENIEILKPIMKKIKSLEQGSYEQSGKKLKSLMTTIKRTMKKHQSNMIFDYYAGDRIRKIGYKNRSLNTRAGNIGKLTGKKLWENKYDY